MSNEIGKIIGKVVHTLSITNDQEDKVQITVGIDFSNSSDTDIKSWLISNRVIAGQRPWRSLPKAELEKLNNKTFAASTIGQKVKSFEEVKKGAESAFDSMDSAQQLQFIKDLQAKAAKVTKSE